MFEKAFKEEAPIPYERDEILLEELERAEKEDPDLARKLDLLDGLRTEIYEKKRGENGNISIVEKKTGGELFSCRQEEYWMLEILRNVRKEERYSKFLESEKPGELSH